MNADRFTEVIRTFRKSAVENVQKYLQHECLLESLKWGLACGGLCAMHRWRRSKTLFMPLLTFGVIFVLIHGSNFYFCDKDIKDYHKKLKEEGTLGQVPKIVLEKPDVPKENEGS